MSSWVAFKLAEALQTFRTTLHETFGSHLADCEGGRATWHAAAPAREKRRLAGSALQSDPRQAGLAAQPSEAHGPARDRVGRPRESSKTSINSGITGRSARTSDSSAV